MSAITVNNIYEEIDYGIKYHQGYSVENGKPFEIRCLICGLEFLQNLDNDCDNKNIILK